MSELFFNSSKGLGLIFPERGSADINENDIEWQSSGTENFWLKPLCESSTNGAKTWLMKIDPGAWSPMHTHAEFEQIYVLQGSFYDQYKTYNPGDLIVRAPNEPHEAGSKTGALAMVIYIPAFSLSP